MPKSLRKFIRREKARIRREVLDIKGQEKQISKLYQKITSEKSKVLSPPRRGRGTVRMSPFE